MLMFIIKDDISQLEHLTVVSLFAVLLLCLPRMHEFFLHNHHKIDAILGLGGAENVHLCKLRKILIPYKDHLLNSEGVLQCAQFIQNDYQSSQLRRNINRVKRYIESKYFLLYSKTSCLN
jgi:hypothetical protein